MQQSIGDMLKVQLAAPTRAPYTGDPMVDSIDSMLYNNGQPLTAGSSPLYGTYWDGMGKSAQQSLAQAAPFVQGGVFLVAGMWMVGPSALLGATCVAQGALSMGGFDAFVNKVGGATAGMMASSVGQAFYFGAVNEIPGIGNVFAASMSAKAFSEGDILGGLMFGVDAFRMRGACFTGEMLIDVEGGKKRADAIRVGDLLWSRSEFDPDGELTLKEVEEVFVLETAVLNLHVAGQILRTTAEHPFWVDNRKAWVPAAMLEIGDLLRTRCGQLVAVQGVADAGEVTTVYNWRIADYHTYFVSSEDRAVSLWAHNACKLSDAEKEELAMRYRDSVQNGTVMDWGGLSGRQKGYVKDMAYELYGVEAATGPKRGNATAHNAKILEIATGINASGHGEVIAGGRLGIGERVISTQGGYMNNRRPDIIVRLNDGTLYGINVGLEAKPGVPVPRERLALADLNNQGGLPTVFESYGLRSQFR
jgi:hypothetical protein